MGRFFVPFCAGRYRGRGDTVDAEAEGLRHSEAAGYTPVSDANPAKRIAAEKEEQGSERSFRRKEEAESSGLCDDAIPPLVPPWHSHTYNK